MAKHTALPIPDAIAAVRAAAEKARIDREASEASSKHSRETIKQAHASGARVTDIAAAAGVTEGRIHQIIGPVRT